jgi:hypothetical protein
VTVWKRDVREPFASDDDFWVSVAASVDALLTLILASAITLLFGAWGAIAFALPIGLLVRAGLTGSRSAHRTRTMFATVDLWRHAERQAVASVMVGAVVRPRWRTRRS